MGEVIKIGDDVTVTITAAKDGSVRIGIMAPPNVLVHREEVYDKIARASDATDPL